MSNTYPTCTKHGIALTQCFAGDVAVWRCLVCDAENSSAQVRGNIGSDPISRWESTYQFQRDEPGSPTQKAAPVPAAPAPAVLIPAGAGWPQPGPWIRAAAGICASCGVKWLSPTTGIIPPRCDRCGKPWSSLEGEWSMPGEEKAPAAPAPEPEITTDALERWTQRQYENALRRRTDREMAAAPAPEATREAAAIVTLRLPPTTCPNCSGAGHISRPPWIPGDVREWTGSGSETYQCPSCHGAGIVYADAEVTRLHATVAAQAREIETLRADKARLDCLEQHARWSLHNGCVTFGIPREWVGLNTEPTIRAAIDAALAARAPEPQS